MRNTALSRLTAIAAGCLFAVAGVAQAQSSGSGSGSNSGPTTTNPTGATGTDRTGATGSDPSTAATGTPSQYGATSGVSDSAGATGTPNSTVTSIEVVQRTAGDTSTSAGTVAGAAVGGTTGATMSGDRVYRITLRTDDGRTQVITQEGAPTFSTGDRVRLSSGVIQR